MKSRLLLVALCLFPLIGCIEQNARDASAALNGAITAAQKQYQTACTADVTQKPCVVIADAIRGQQALITTIEAYCAWSVANPPADPNTAPCSHVKTAQAALSAAINNANQLVTDLGGIVK